MTCHRILFHLGDVLSTVFPKFNHVVNNEQSQLTNTMEYLGSSPTIPVSGLAFAAAGASSNLLNDDDVGIGGGDYQSDELSRDSNTHDDVEDDGGGKMAAYNNNATGNGSDTGSMNDYSTNNYPLNERVSFLWSVVL